MKISLLLAMFMTVSTTQSARVSAQPVANLASAQSATASSSAALLAIDIPTIKKCFPHCNGVGGVSL